jgi:RNA polymerase sigma-70 factor (ECF subfamily)
VDDRVPFEDFFKAEERRLLGALCLLTHDRIEAEEIDQDAFVRVWERWDRVGGMADPTGYLYRVAMNLFRSRYRRAERMDRLVFDLDPTTDGLASVEDRDEVSRYLAQLIPQQRAAVVLTVLLDMTSEEAGRTLGLAASTVRVLTTRARASMRADTSRDATGGDDDRR